MISPAKTKTPKTRLRTTRKRLALLGFAVVLTVGGSLTPGVLADQYDDKINALNGDSAVKRSNVGVLSIQATNLQDAISKLQAQIAGLQAQISVNEQKRDETIAAISKAEADLVQQKSYLSDSIKASYVDGGVSSLEMLASSQNINQFVDQQQYQNSVQGQIQRTLDTIKQLQAKLKSDKTTLERMIADLDKMRSDVAAQKAEQSRLLSLNQDQQAALNAQIATNNSEVTKLRSQQAAENARLFDGGKIVYGGACDSSKGDTYPRPWCSGYLDQYTDNWGMYSRECVSYTAWKVHESGRFMPNWGGIGNANQWDDNAIAAGIPVSGTPKAGDVAIKNSQPYGHAMYVESVNADGTINISQYNADWKGSFSKVYNVNPGGLVFIHF